MTKQYKLIKHQYMDGTTYRPNLHVIVEAGDDTFRSVGGLVEMKGKCLAFAIRSGAKGLVEKRVDDIIRRADVVVWGATRREAAMKIKEHLA